MKLVKMSLAAAVLLGASAFAIDNVKISGDAKVLYSTNNQENLDMWGNNQGGLFEKDSSAADTALRIGVTGDLTQGVSFGVTGYAVSTLGLENNLVSNTWDSAHGVSVNNGATFDPLGTNGLEVNDAMWMGEAWIAGTLGKTTAKVGRMELDTPFAFSEKWSSTPNTFEAAVLINQDIPDTTLIGAYVGKGNGVNALGTTMASLAYNDLLPDVLNYKTNGDPLNPNPYLSEAQVQAALRPLGLSLNMGTMNGSIIGNNVVGTSGAFHTFANKGAYAVAAINNSFKPLTAQAWYYNVSNVADAYWLQADWACQLIDGVKVGVQYADMSPKGQLQTTLSVVDNALLTTFGDDTKGYSVKLGYEGIENLKIQGAYSDVDGDGILKIANVATDNLGGAKSKLYTEAWWNYGYVGAPGAESYNLTAEYNIKDVAKIAAYFTEASVKRTNAIEATDMQEIALTATKSFGQLDTSLVYISTKADDQNVKVGNLTGSRFDTVQAYLTLNF